ncbi:DUF3727 domain-containing protein [filamentous cyanobacterium LEGE 11480]|uniref:DUF3727 domain-containing protein n=1 Tax=Romeriopsis navalis LEGE 11480 TaxID=2777977 RepID=A0A928VTJ1_9CYAN|nr:DUF3727 domain-containing protein [Romeriopsis navalis]MBE9032287.1 DUF3727 domain-containing protein [Romeriopsis navalis LEGE 11480]
MDENELYDAPTVTLTDDSGRQLDCYVEQSIELDAQEFVLLLPVDAPVEIFAWREDGDDDDEAAVLVEDRSEIAAVFRTAKAVLEEQNLTLKETAIVLTVEGDLPELEEELEEEDEEFEDQEELQLIASFYNNEQEYAIYTPLDPYFILAQLDDKGNPQILSNEELKRLEPLLPMLEDQLFDALE